MQIKHFSIRIDETLLSKLHVTANYEGRSANNQINILIRRCVQAFEEQHGTIEIHPLSKDKGCDKD